jgi:hypothetical protein
MRGRLDPEKFRIILADAADRLYRRITQPASAGRFCFAVFSMP